MPTTLQGVQPCTGFPPQQGRLYTQLQPWQSTHHCSKSTVFLWKVISPILAIAHFLFCFGFEMNELWWDTTEPPDTNAVQVYFQNGDALPQENGALRTVLCPSSISQSTHKPPSTGQCPTHPSQKSEGHPLRQPKGDNGRVEQSEPKVFLNFIIRGVKTLCLMLAVVKINYSIVGKKGLKSHNNYIHFDVY